MKILVVGGYKPDQLQSMIRYTDLLAKLYEPYGQVFLWHPSVIFSRIPLMPSLVRKYLAYIDKIIISPVKLLFYSRNFDLIHIADHGYSYYSLCCAQSRCIVTCHDLLAFRGALGDTSAATGSSLIGIWLQRLIMAGLRYSGFLVFDSHASYSDYLSLSVVPSGQRCAVIPVPLNPLFTPNPEDLFISNDEVSLIPNEPYLLMVGSAIQRKNRLLSLKIIINLVGISPYKLVFAGESLTNRELTFIERNNLKDKVITIQGLSHALLNNLYCNAHALLFPSFSEGFGWPIIEAQACACPVIASNTTSIPEVAGDAALFADPCDDKTFTDHVLSLEDMNYRKELISKGFLNIRQFSFDVVRHQLASFVFGPL